MTLLDILLGVLYMIAAFSVMVSVCLAAEAVFYHFHSTPAPGRSVRSPRKSRNKKNRKGRA